MIERGYTPEETLEGIQDFLFSRDLEIDSQKEILVSLFDGNLFTIEDVSRKDDQIIIYITPLNSTE